MAVYVIAPGRRIFSWPYDPVNLDPFRTHAMRGEERGSGQVVWRTSRRVHWSLYSRLILLKDADFVLSPSRVFRVTC